MYFGDPTGMGVVTVTVQKLDDFVLDDWHCNERYMRECERMDKMELEKRV